MTLSSVQSRRKCRWPSLLRTTKHHGTPSSYSVSFKNIHDDWSFLLILFMFWFQRLVDRWIFMSTPTQLIMHSVQTARDFPRTLLVYTPRERTGSTYIRQGMTVFTSILFLSLLLVYLFVCRYLRFRRLNYQNIRMLNWIIVKLKILLSSVLYTIGHLFLPNLFPLDSFEHTAFEVYPNCLFRPVN